MLPASPVGPKDASCDIATVLHSVTLYTELEQGQVCNAIKHEANKILTYELDFDLQHRNLQVEYCERITQATTAFETVECDNNCTRCHQLLQTRSPGFMVCFEIAWPLNILFHPVDQLL